MSQYPALNRHDFERFLSAFSTPGTLVFHNNKWLGLNLQNKTFTVHANQETRKSMNPLW